MRDLLLSTALIPAFLAAILLVNLAPPRSGAVAVIVNPFGGNAAEAIAAADGRLLRAGRWPWIAVGIKSQSSGFGTALHAAGAWLILSPLAAGGCLNASD